MRARCDAAAPARAQISRSAGTDGDDGYVTRLHTANLIQGAEALLEQISSLKLSLVLGDLDAIVKQRHEANPGLTD